MLPPPITIVLLSMGHPRFDHEMDNWASAEGSSEDSGSKGATSRSPSEGISSSH
jgi:hypothetical protein